YCAGDSTAELFIKSQIRYDLFLFDLDWLNETGVELVRLARSLPHRQHTRIIMVAAEITNSLEGLARSADECAAKTGEMSALVETIHRLCQEGQRTREGPRV